MTFNAYDLSLYPGVVITILLAIIGVFGNCNIVSCRKRSLRSACNIIVACGALSDVFHQGSHFIFAYYYVTGNAFQNLQWCYYLNILPLFNMNYGSILTLSIGVDRLFCITAPVIYARIKLNTYLLIFMIPQMIYGFVLLYICHKSVVVHNNDSVVCMIAEMYVGKAQAYWSSAQTILYILVIVCYIILGLVVRSKKLGKAIRRFIRSLMFIMITTVFGWFMVAFTLMFYTTTVTQPKEFDLFFIHMNVGWAANLGLASNYVIYFACSDEYRKAFYEQLKILTFGRIKQLNHNVTKLAVTTTKRSNSSIKHYSSNF
ncbi:unnamed protein product [Bursaphelenchus okinawaensis]|uniref:G-protein coupled receptors family 1 profile domain-containing protein n=1 Tax=Bursaphelenchus okinawaensis TaxID=465554 RepID=A0A811L6V6_9BILA|nr:unnamed protein product [Bursaphelenchus okinawaensis]CAG9119225.1 unnamed protein product [Bursaphelenchus okinawaensis]